MDEQSKRKMIRAYFEPPPSWTLWAIVVGAVFFSIGLSAESFGVMFFGGAIAIIGYVVRYNSSKEKPTDQQMDEWFEEDLKQITKRANDKTGINETELIGEPVYITGPRFWNSVGAEVLFKKGADNVIRFTPVDVSIINFTSNQLVVYKCTLDLTTGNPLNESTDEYFYKDVVSVSTQSKSLTYDQSILAKNFLKDPMGSLSSMNATAGKMQVNLAETFVLTTSGGTSVEVVIKDPVLINISKGGIMPTTRAENAIQTIRKVLREKKA